MSTAVTESTFESLGQRLRKSLLNHPSAFTILFKRHSRIHLKLHLGRSGLQQRSRVAEQEFQSVQIAFAFDARCCQDHALHHAMNYTRWL